MSLNPSAIFSNIIITSKLNETCNDLRILTVVYNLNKTIRKKIFNLNTFAHSINVDVILENPDSLSWNCKGSQYVDKDHGHIVICDLRIISGHTLQSGLGPGPELSEKTDPRTLEKAHPITKHELKTRFL